MHGGMKKIGGVLSAARKAKGMTQAELCDRTDIAPRTLIDLENDKRYPTHEVLYKLVHALDLSADHIFWPERVSFSPDQEQLVRALASCNERDKAIFMEMAWAFVKAVSDAKVK